MRDINKIVKCKMKAMQARTAKLHAQLDTAIRAGFREQHTTSVVETNIRQRRRVVRGTQVCAKDTRIGTDIIAMAYGELTSDPTARLKGKDIQASHIRVWLEDEYCTTVSEADVQVAMVAFKHTK